LAAGEVTTGLTESNGSITGFMMMMIIIIIKMNMIMVALSY